MFVSRIKYVPDFIKNFWNVSANKQKKIFLYSAIVMLINYIKLGENVYWIIRNIQENCITKNLH